ncbi:DinB family protein [Salinibacterium sp. G-O1]|uniref:DinB family protein n=1 Tax=Salinibacterium sp. G-O1 TaxID=3046208 RepID=UPI0024B90AB7|nr:DinB family protein [Salinibacterium sp. G-O1]MDJ0335753.1 DinB family protein [Salinibacterium sp. G-O1]
MGDAKDDLRSYLRLAREALVWKLDGLSDYDVRRPLVRTGTNLLGLVKHCAGVEAGYLGAVFGRPFPEELPWMEFEAEPNADMWATADESRADILSLFERVAAHSEATLDVLDLDSLGSVPWWSDDRNPVTLHRIVIHLIAELNRHTGHADIVRELIDGAAGLRQDNDNLPEGDAGWWTQYVERLEEVAKQARS